MASRIAIVALNIAILLLLWILSLLGWVLARFGRKEQPQHWTCPECGYDFLARVGQICPECGMPTGYAGFHDLLAPEFYTTGYGQ